MPATPHLSHLPEPHARQADETPVSRRRILGKLRLAAVGGGAMAATGILGGGRAAADSGDALIVGIRENHAQDMTLLSVDTHHQGLSVKTWDIPSRPPLPPGFALWGDAHNGSTGVLGTVPDYGYGVTGSAGHGFGVLGLVNHSSGIGAAGEGADGGTGVRGTVPNGGYGVLGKAGIGFGVRGEVTDALGIGVAGSGPGVGVLGEGETGVRGVGNANGAGVHGRADGSNGWGVWGSSESGYAVRGEAGSGAVGVYGRAAPYGYGVRGVSGSGFGVHGEVTDGTGVQGVSETSFGVRGNSTGGTGVRGQSQTSTGVYGRSIGHTGVIGYGGAFGVVGQCDAGGTAVDASSSNGGTGVWGRSLPTGYGVRGESSYGFGLWGSAPNGTAVSGQGRLGGEFSGTRAAVRLVPTTTVGSPSAGAHVRGELVCDRIGGLWFCKTGGTPGTWVKLA